MSFALARPRDLAEALRASGGTEFIAGGTDMLQLVREGVRQPQRLVDLLPVLGGGISLAGNRLRIEAGVTMEALATDAEVARAVPMIAQALLESASVQVRNMATIGGNLLQRTRCGYFRDSGVPSCNKRIPGSGCAAIGGENRILAVLGTSPHCIASHPSDLPVALMALDAEILIAGADGERRMAIADFYPLPGVTPERETELRESEVIVAIELGLDKAAQNSVYVKVRDRASFEWALLSAAVGLELAEGRVKTARVAMGGVGTRPWRLRNVEEALQGQNFEPEAIERAAARSIEGAKGHGGNDFKLLLMPRLLARTISLAASRE
jgi:xanthine dehydrogenase YagS FAD-binding subunit